MLLSETISDPIFQIVPWVVFFPAIGVILNLLFGKYLGERGSGILATVAAALSFVVSLILAVSLSGMPEAVNVPFAQWINMSNFSVGWNFRVDTLSLTMMLVVSGVGTLIHLYAIEYMHADVRHNGDVSRYPRFFVFFNLFIFAMMVLVSAGNYLMLFVGWEGVGLCSYLLIGFWYDKGKDGIANAKAGKKAFVTNRVGDFGLLLAMFIMFFSFGSLDFDTVFGLAAQHAVAPVVITITLFMILGVMGKSAQLPLYIWLPDAMAGPTPVSALIHAATMVTAGVYLVARSAPLYTLAPVSQAAVTWVGALTAIFAAGIALTQFDIKKVLAYSTISQLGFMVAAVGMGAFTAGMFHLVTHAFFKALLFLSAGSVIQGIERGMHHGEHHQGADIDPQDMRNMGGLQKRMPVTFLVYIAGALALAGVAPLAGFFSKDEILLASQHTSPAIFVILTLAAFLTAFYMGRQIFLVFFGKSRSDGAENATESKPLVTVPLMALAVLAVTGGALNFPGVHTLDHWLEHTIKGSMPLEFSWTTAIISVGLALLGIFLAWTLYGKRQIRATDPDALQSKMPVLFGGLSRKWWLEDVYAWLITDPYGKGPFDSFAGFMADSLDAGFIDKISTTLGILTGKLAQFLRKAQNGFVHTYALSILLGVVLILVFIISH